MKKIVSLILVVTLLGGCLVGCSSKPDYVISSNPPEVQEIDKPSEDKPIVEEDLVVEIVNVVNNIGFNEFENNIINYVNNSELQKENYCISPLSIRLALSLLAEGVAGETQQQIFTALGVSSIEELRELSVKMNTMAEEISANGERTLEMYEEYPDAFSGEPSVSILKVNNSIWKNDNQSGLILDSYKANIEEYYNGVSENVKADLMKDSINEWVDTNTHGMIPAIVTDNVKDSNIVLVNTLYLKDSWSDKFNEEATVEKDFTTIDGEKIKKDFMCRQDDYYFYEDKDSKILIIPTQSNIYVAFVLGDNSNITEKIRKATYEDTIVELPKMDIESSLDNGFIVNYLKTLGVQDVFDYTKADFSNMVELKDGEPNVYVNDIIHKTKLTTDEKGIEGAAASAVMITCGAALEEPKKPKEFIADEPFSFYVFTDNINYEVENIERFADIDLLFYGQNVK